MVCFKANFILRTINHYLILCYVNDVPNVFSESDLKTLTVYICQHSVLHFLNNFCCCNVLMFAVVHCLTACIYCIIILLYVLAQTIYSVYGRVIPKQNEVRGESDYWRE